MKTRIAIATLLMGVTAQAQAPIAMLLDIECENALVTALVVQVNPVDRPKVIRIEINHKTSCGTPT